MLGLGQRNMDEILSINPLLFLVPPVWVATLILLVQAVRTSPMWMERWLQARQHKRDAKDQDWTRRGDEIARLAERVNTLETRCGTLEREVEKYREDSLYWKDRAITAEATLQGGGDAMNRAQMMLSSDRIEDAARKKREKPDDD